MLENPALPVNPPIKTLVQIIEFNKEAGLSSEGVEGIHHGDMSNVEIHSERKTTSPSSHPQMNGG